MEFRIKHTWDGLPVSHNLVMIWLRPDNAGLLMEVHGPFCNDPQAPLGEPGKPFDRLWDYEGRANLTRFALFFSYIKKELPLEFEVTVMKTKWEVFLSSVSWSRLVNFGSTGVRICHKARCHCSFSDSGSRQHKLREFKSHCLEFFKDLDMKEVIGEDWKQL
ncbi:UPF0462 protein C4orf33 homolog [Pseudopipra pipra]|uniref:UPF0462 protein C4orf33 homolog n=1 Tax=Pseudopipra pipra TaxID=415032 RepID=UPI003139C604